MKCLRLGNSPFSSLDIEDNAIYRNSIRQRTDSVAFLVTLTMMSSVPETSLTEKDFTLYHEGYTFHHVD